MKRAIPYEHFHPDEKPFVDKAAGWIEDAAVRKLTRRTDFLDPRQAFIVLSLINRGDGAVVRLDGGHPDAERRRAVIVPDFLDPAYEPIGIALLAVDGDDRAGELDHGDYLGAMLGLGVRRDKIGDIHVHERGAHILVAEELASFFASQLTQVGKARVDAGIRSLDELVAANQALEELHCTVASMRLDGVVGEAARLSRAKALAPIQAGRCKVNWKVEDNPARQVKEGDVISIQGFGRFQILKVEGVSKSGRYRLAIGKFA